ncbi:MAG: hypothetical protein H6R27_1755 [Proteobacteria bacterium]|nr:hypothetical protein [Pseudomonadota bacterium]
MNRLPILLAATAALGALSLGACSREEPSVSFSKDVQPVLNARCGACHVPGQPGYEASGLSTASYDALMEGTKFGAVVIPGDALSSTLTMLVEGRADPSIRMPHGDQPLAAAEQKILHDWVAQGAKNN